MEIIIKRMCLVTILKVSQSHQYDTHCISSVFPSKMSIPCKYSLQEMFNAWNYHITKKPLKGICDAVLGHWQNKWMKSEKIRGEKTVIDGHVLEISDLYRWLFPFGWNKRTYKGFRWSTISAWFCVMRSPIQRRLFGYIALNLNILTWILAYHYNSIFLVVISQIERHT